MNLRQRFAEALMPNYGTVELALTHGEGAVVYDVDGKDYLDFIGGIATSVLGHAHPALVAAVGDQVAKIAHTSNLFINQPAVELAERLLGLFDVPGKVFFTNSGAEANECALKLAMIHGRPDGRTRFVAAADGFHGRTLGALALTGKDVIREPFAPFGVDVTFVPYGDVAALAETVDHTVAAVFLEPLQGEAGVKPPPAGYLSTARTVCDNAGALLVLDEIQSGMGRTGAWFAHQQENVTPDVVTMAKGLAGGLPMGACIGLGPVGDLFGPGAHGSTFGGNPVSAAAALAVLDTIANDGLMDNAVTMGRRLVDGMAAMGHPLVQSVRGRGLWLGIVLNEELAAPVVTSLRDRGVLANAVRPDVVRVAPPLIVTEADVDRFLLELAHAADVVYPRGGRP